jgi:IS5 family transposase
MYFATIGHIEADAESRLVRSVRGTSGNASDVTQGNSLLKGQGSVAFGDAGYQGIEKRSDANESVTGHAARRPGKRRALNKENAAEALIDKTEKMKASNLAKVEHPFRVVKRQFRFVELRKSSLVKARNGTFLKACA